MGKKHVILMITVAFVLGISSFASAASVVVQKGDSMYKIAKRYNVSFTEVLRLNKEHHVNVDLIHPNDIVYIPDGSTGTNTANHSDRDTYPQGNASARAGSTDAKIEAVFMLVNKERSKQGLKPLTLNTKLTDIATEKARDMAVKNYFSHTSPTYGSPFQMMQHFGVTYKSAGENIAAGQKTAEQVMQSWMNSSGHRANILNVSFTDIGIGYYAGGSYGTEWVQMFIGN